MNKTLKMDSALALCNSLIKWLQSLQIPGPQNSAFDLADGVAVANACTQISPEYFNQDWISKIKPDVGTNWRLKVSNLKKIVEKIIEFYQDELNLNILDAAKPDCTKIGETADQMELGKLLQLVLGAAVNCENKQEYYITRIMSMEESVQQSIMQAIQSLDEATRGRGPFSLTDISDLSKIQRLTSELDRVNDAKEMLAQRCHELELQVACLTEEKLTIQTENQRLQNRLDDTSPTLPKEPSQTMELRKQVTELRATLFKLEATRDDNWLKIEDYEKQISMLHARIEELQFEAGNAKQLKDEVDALTATAEKVQAMEMTLASYKKKLEGYADLKKQVKLLEAKNSEYFQQNLSLEEEIKKGLSLKSQMEVYKKQLAALNKQLDEEMGKGVKLEFERAQLEAKIKVLEREREVLITERDSVKDLNEELRIEVKPSPTSVAKELAVPELRERLSALEAENRTLRASVATSELLEEWNQQQEELRSQLKAANQRILEQEAKLLEVARLKDALNAKETELQASKEQYKRNLDKAREIIGSMHLRGEEVLGNRCGGQMKESEARLLTTAFLNLGEACQREAVDARLALLSAGQGQTFLSRQRHPTPRKSINSRLK